MFCIFGKCKNYLYFCNLFWISYHNFYWKLWLLFKK